MNGNTITQLFAQGKVAFMLGGPWVRANLDEAKPGATYGVDYATAPIPVPAAGDPSASTSGGWQIGIFKNTKNMEAASKLLAFIMQPDQIVKLAKVEGFSPYVTGMEQEPWSTDPFYDAYKEVLPASGLPIAPVPELAEVSAAFDSATKKAILDGNADVTEALRGFDDTANSKIITND